MFKNCCYIILLALPNFGAVYGIQRDEKAEKHQVSGDIKFESILPNLYRYKDACNSYVLKSGSSAILIDAGSESISDQLEEIGVTSIDWVLHTHCHRDQCICDPQLRKTGTKIAAGKPDADVLQPVEAKAPFHSSDTAFLQKLVPDWSKRMAPFEKPGVDRLLTDGELINWNQYKIEIINTPGHTEGSISYFVEVNGQKICFTGDLIMKGGYVRDLYNMQWTYLENPGIDSSVVSLQKISSLNPDRLLPSHGEIIDQPDKDIRMLSIRLKKAQHALLFERAGRWNWSGFVQISPHVVQDCGTTSQIIIAPDGEALMFDCGDEFTLNRLEEVKKMFGIKRIAIIIPSHWHYDHVDGIHEVAKAEGAKIWVWKGLAEHLEFPDRFPTTCWTGKSIKPDRLLLEGEEFKWGGYSFKVYHYPAHMEEQMALSAVVDELKFLFIGDGTASNRESHMRSAIHGYNGISLKTGIIKTAQSFYDADPYICLPAHSNGFATHEETRDEFMIWAVATTDIIQGLLLPPHPETGYDPYWASFYPARTKAMPGEKVQIALRLKNFSNHQVTGKFQLKKYKDIEFEEENLEYVLGPGEIKDIPFVAKVNKTASSGIYIITADIEYDGDFFAVYPQGYIELNE